VINFPTVSSRYSELYSSGARSGVSRKSGGAERWAGVTEKRWSGMERSAEREVAELERGGERALQK